MVCGYIFVSICAVLMPLMPSGATHFLHADPSLKRNRTWTEDFSQSLYSDLAGKLGRIKIDKIQQAIRPTYASLSKDEHGNLNQAGVRYALHRYFVQRHGWYVKGLRPSDGAWSSSSPAAVMKDRVPEYIQNFFEQRLSRYGFGMQDLALFAGTLEDLIRQEATGQLEVAYRALRLNTSMRYPSAYLDVVLDAYMMAYITGGNLSAITPGKFNAQEKVAQSIYPAWPATKLWLRDIRQSVDHAKRYSRNMFESNVSFAEVAYVVDEIGHQFGPFQALECHGIKSALIEKEHKGTGRVLLSRFYAHTLGGQWEFSESVNYLRQLGALDETDPLRTSVVIPNYVNSMSNCIAPSGFYSVCCRDECESLLAHVEEKIAAPEAMPGLILELISNLPSETMEAPRNLSITLVQRLQEIADHHGGRVPLHGRLFSQWMHHTYPRECNFPHAAGTTTSLNLLDVIEAGENPAASEEEMRKHLDEGLHDGVVLNLTASAEMDDVLPWTSVEELVVGRREVLPLGNHVFKNTMLVASFVSMLAILTRRTFGGAALEAKVEHHFV